MNMTVKRLELKMGAWPTIDNNNGEMLKLTVPGYRKNKLNNFENHVVVFELNRYMLKRLLRQVATMHERDRARLAKEAARIEGEILAVRQPEVPT